MSSNAVRPLTVGHRLRALHDAGQSIWLDHIDRAMLHNGDLERRIRDDRVTGMTSNPAIFEKALAGGSAYDEQIRAAPSDLTPAALFELIETTDVRTACDIFAATHDQTRGGDGYVSIEVSAGVAHDTAATVEEARRLWRMVDRRNVMIKVPGTTAGAEAVRQLTAQGINVNITLLFAVEAYERVIDAYLDGLEDRANRGEPVDHLASVGSFFVSRVDTEVDRQLEAIGGDALRLRGEAAVANAKMAYQLFLQKFSGTRWGALAEKGARVQRPLWASTGTKNPAYSDVKYVDDLIGPDTVNTMPPQTLDAFRDHGTVARTIDADVDDARRVLTELDEAGVSLRDVTEQLLRDGISKFALRFPKLEHRSPRSLRPPG